MTDRHQISTLACKLKRSMVRARLHKGFIGTVRAGLHKELVEAVEMAFLEVDSRSIVSFRS